MFRCFDSEPDAVAADFENCDLDIVGDDDFFVSLATYDEHLVLFENKEQTRHPKNTEELGFEGRLVHSSIRLCPRNQDSAGFAWL